MSAYSNPAELCEFRLASLKQKTDHFYVKIQILKISKNTFYNMKNDRSLETCENVNRFLNVYSHFLFINKYSTVC